MKTKFWNSSSKVFIGTLLAGASFGMLFAGCDSTQQTYRDTVNKQNDSFTQAREQDLNAAGKLDQATVYKGTVHLDSSNQDFDCVVELETTTDFTRLTQGQDQTETLEVPKLTGSMRFPAIENIPMSDMSSYSALTQPMGGYMKVIFDYGNFNPRNSRMSLPYTVPGYTASSLGELQGKLVNGRFTGTWFSKPFGNVGTFDLVQVTSPQTQGDGAQPNPSVGSSPVTVSSSITLSNSGDSVSGSASMSGGTTNAQ